MNDNAHGRGNRERGSGTILGIVLVLVTFVMLSTAAVGGNIVVVRSHARSISDVAAVNAAYWLQATSADPGSSSVAEDGQACALASRIADANNTRLESCSQQGADVQVEVAAETSVPFIPTVTGWARAGPIECG